MQEHESLLADEGWPAAEAATASHRQRSDGGAVDAVGAATDQAIGQDRLLDMVGGGFDNASAQCRHYGGEPEQSAAIPVMGMALGLALAAVPALIFLALAMDGGGGLVDVLMNGSVTVDVNVNMDLQSCDLLGDFIEAIGRGGTIRECERNRRRDDACKVDQRNKGRDAASRQACHNSKHRITALD
jgi:hypothetical protein